MRVCRSMRAAWLLVGVVLVGCGNSVDDLGPKSSNEAGTQKYLPLRLTKLNGAEHPHLHNVLQLTDSLYSGSEPHGDAGFAKLKELGVDVIVSVDGAKPDLEAARRHGLRYVHIPIGYDAIPETAGQSLARVVRESAASDEVMYFHCHHGKHRGPAAAAIACIAAGAADNAAALHILSQAGTSKDYAGLWRDVKAYRPPGPDVELPELVEVARVDSLAAAMAQLDRAFDHLKLCEAAQWQTPPGHADLVPAQEALIAKEAFREAARNLSDDYDATFRQALEDSETTAGILEQQLRAGDAPGAAESFIGLGKACQQCHVEYRN